MKTAPINFKKYVLLSFLALGLSLSSCRKVVEVPIVHTKVQVPIVVKVTGENCPFCGGYGWTNWETISTDLADIAFCWANYAGNYAPADGFRGNELRHPNSDAVALLGEFSGVTGYPNFVTNMVSSGTSIAGASRKAYISAGSTGVKISAGFKHNIQGNTLTVNAEAKLWDDLNGDYYMGAYVVEDKIIAYQEGNSAGNNASHHLVFRGSMSSSTWGEQIFTGSARSGDILRKTFSVTLPSDYNKSNLTYGIIIWKKVGDKYSYVNAATNQKAH